QRLAQGDLAGREAVAEKVVPVAVLQGYITGPAGRRGEREADELSLHGVDGVRLRIDGHVAALARLGDPRLEAFQAHHRLVGAAVDRGGGCLGRTARDERRRDEEIVARSGRCGGRRRRGGGRTVSG